MPIQCRFQKPEGVLEVEAPDIRPPEKGEIGFPGTSPPQPEGSRLASLPRQFGDLEKHECPSDDRLGLPGSSARMVLRPRMQVAPSTNVHVAITLVVFSVLKVRRRPSYRIVADELGSMGRG